MRVRLDNALLGAILGRLPASTLPLVYLAFANAQDAHLDLLKAESRDVYQALAPLVEAGQIAVQREESSERKELYDDLVANGDRLVVFHYGGHANGKLLQLEDGAQSAVGLARLLGQLRSLKLVFLNGCATQGHVTLLRDAGVPAVIATSVPIGDQKAHEFSIALYTALARGKSIADAFVAGTGFLEGKYGAGARAGVAATRDVDMGTVEDSPPTAMAWGLFTRDDAAEDLAQWRLPDARSAWRVQLEDARGPLRDLDGAPQVIDHRLPVRALPALRCSRCGTSTTVPAQESATAASCPVCGSTDVVRTTASTTLGDQQLAFTISEDHARARVREFAPSMATDAIRLRRLYVPFWVFDVDTRTTFEGERGWNRALGEVTAKFEWEPVKDAVDLPINGYLVAAGDVPQGKDSGKRDWYWEIGRAETLQRPDAGTAYALLDRPVQKAFSEVAGALKTAVDAEITARVGGQDQRNISSDTRYRRVAVRSVMLPYWYADAGGTTVVVNGQTGALRSVQLPAPTGQSEAQSTRGLDDGDLMPNTERTYEPGAPAATSASLAVSVYSGAGIGLMVGVLLALSASPTVGVFIGALGTGLAALLGLNDNNFSKAKGLRIGTLGLAVLAGVGLGLYVRTHDSLAPSLDAQRKEYMALGYPEREALDIIRARRLGAPLSVGGEASADGKATMAARSGVATANSLLFSAPVEINACGDFMQARQFDNDPTMTPEIVIGNFQVQGKGWKSLADATTARLSGDDQKRLLFIARDAACDARPPKPAAGPCAQMRGTDDAHPPADLEAQFASIAELRPVLERVRREVSKPGQLSALHLLAGVFCPTE